jgi:hypothetical protein
LPRYRLMCLERMCRKSFTVSTKVFQEKLADDYDKKNAKK